MGNDKEYIEELFSCLTERERYVLAAYFDDPPMTLVEIGSILGVSRKRVRQMKWMALKKLESRRRKINACHKAGIVI